MNDDPFEIAGDMEDDLAAVGDFAHAITTMSMTSPPGDEDTNAILRLAWAIKDHARDLEEQRFRRSEAAARSSSARRRRPSPARARRLSPARARRLRSRMQKFDRCTQKLAHKNVLSGEQLDSQFPPCGKPNDKLRFALLKVG
jgi:hypothetical protein